MQVTKRMVRAGVVAVLVVFAAGTATAQEPLGEVASYVITFDSGGDADAAWLRSSAPCRS